MRDGAKVSPIMYGGGQQRGLRSGTENLPGIAGFARIVASKSSFSTPIARRVAEGCGLCAACTAVVSSGDFAPGRKTCPALLALPRRRSWYIRIWSVNGEIRYLKALILQIGHGLQHRRMLDFRRNQIATTACFEDAAQLMHRILCEDYGNPSSLHHKGVEAEAYLRYANDRSDKDRHALTGTY